MNLAEVALTLGARAAGAWRVEGRELVQAEFWAAPDLDPAVAEDFSRATRRVPLSQADLGIVGAVIDAMPRISATADLSPEGGSGLWLRKFAADRSVAVPYLVGGVAVAVASVALRGPGDEEAVRLLRAFLEGLVAGHQDLDGRTTRPQNKT